MGAIRVFLSYHSPDRTAAKATAAALASVSGVEPFLDCYDFRAGAFWIPALAKAIADADAMVLLLGRSGPGNWQRLEYYEALDRKAREPVFPIIPVLLAEAQVRLPFLYQIHCLALPEPWAAAGVEQIVRALRGEAPPAIEPWRTVNPYRGLLAMTDADGDFFFGRDSLTAQILDHLRRRSRLTVLVGNSGVGKSSVVQAGVVTALRRQRWPGEEARDWPSDLIDSRSWAFLIVRPGDRPLYALARAFVRQWTEPTDPGRDALAEQWAEGLRRGQSLHGLICATVDQFAEIFGLPPPRRFVLVVDQAEELYTRSTQEEARRFSKVLAGAAGTDDVTVLASLRSDHYGSFQEDEALFAAAATVDVPPLHEDGLRQVIEQPAFMLGAGFEDPSMAERVVGATARQPGALPLLSYLLEDLWKSMQRPGDGVLRWADYPDLIGVRGVLARRAEDYVATVADERQLQRLFMLRLVHVPVEGEPVRRRARRRECTNAEWQFVEDLAGSEWRLLVTAEEGGEATAEVAHEVLLRDWDRLSRWLVLEREFLQWKGELENARRDWKQDGGDEGLLLRGARLLRAEDWLSCRSDDLTTEDRAFINAGIEVRERERRAQVRRRRWKVVNSLAVAVVLFILGAGTTGYYKNTVRWVKRSFEAEHNLHEVVKTADTLVTEVARRLKSLAVSGGTSADPVREIMTKAEESYERLMAYSLELKYNQMQYKQAVMLAKFADIYAVLGNTEEQQKRFKKVRDIMQDLSHKDAYLWLDLADHMQDRQDYIAGALEDYRNYVLQADPDDERAHKELNFLYHDELFAFAEDFDLNQAWLERHPDNLDAQANFAEAAFTVGRFAEAEQRLAALVDHPKLEPEDMVPIRVLEICTLVALDRPDTLKARLDALDDLLEGTRDELAADWTWTFAGSRHFIGEHPELSQHLWLIRLLDAIEKRKVADARAAIGVGQAASAAVVAQ